jgi:hypothetical protein
MPSRLRLEDTDSLPAGEVRQFAARLDAVSEAVRVTVVPPAHNAQGEPVLRLQPGMLTKAPGGTAAEAYALSIAAAGILIRYREIAGLRAAVATLCQLLRQYGRRIPCLGIRDWPDFPRRGVMLDVSRGRVPNLATLKQMATDLAGFKINELQLYFEHTFAYRAHPGVWRGWGALTGRELRQLDAHCRTLGIDLVPNQNSFGHLRHWLEHPRYKPLAEVNAPYPGAGGDFLRYPSTLAPNHPGTIQFLRGLYDELLPHFSSRFFNVGCDETWDLGRGQSRTLCQRKGPGRVYLDFLLQVHREVRRRGKTMMCWGDIILKHPDLIRKLPPDIIALNWGYEADHPFEREATMFGQAGIPFYVCPGTSNWATMIGRNDNAFANLQAAARAGKRAGALGYMITDWGDGGHPQPLAVSYPAFLAGAALSWSGKTCPARSLVSVLSREVFHDRSSRAATALMKLGLAHRKFRYTEPNATPFGATLAAPPSEQRELFCRNGLKYYARLTPGSIRSAQSAVNRERLRLRQAKPATPSGRILIEELDLAARMAEESCRYLLWQQARAANQSADARALAKTGAANLEQIKRDFERYWTRRNKGTPSKCAGFLDWRIRDYRTGRLHYSPTEARLSDL